MVTRSLPKTDEAIVASLKPIAENNAFGKEWRGGDTVLSNAAFGGFVRHANQNWFAVEEKGFELIEGKTTVTMFVQQLREREAKLVVA
jgi:hypothetical protein